MEQQKAQQAQTFDARLAATLDKTYTVKSERDSAMKETANLFKQHIQRTGLGKLYKDSGLIYNPDFVMAMAAEEKARSGNSFVQGQPGGSRMNRSGPSAPDITSPSRTRSSTDKGERNHGNTGRHTGNDTCRRTRRILAGDQKPNPAPNTPPPSRRSPFPGVGTASSSGRPTCRKKPS